MRCTAGGLRSSQSSRAEKSKFLRHPLFFGHTLDVFSTDLNNRIDLFGRFSDDVASIEVR